jgi:galactose mutarotase-like enzyme
LRGWDVVVLESDDLAATIVPGLGGAITSLVHKASSTELMWSTRWGIRERGGLTSPSSREAALYEAYPGGWQTVFPNAGDACVEHGVEWGMHGEVWTTPLAWMPSDAGLRLEATLVRSPFHFTKQIELRGMRLRVTEVALNVGNEPIEVTWSQHPAFGAPLISPDTYVTTNARKVDADVLDSRYASRPKNREWPEYAQPDGTISQLDRLPGPRSNHSRMAFLTDFEDPASAWVAIRNRMLGLEATVRWDARRFPCAWYWLEAGGRKGFPWFSDAYVLAIEPSTSWPGRGISAIRRSTGTQQEIRPGEERTHTVDVEINKA